ncbi:MAG: hypothetical protein KAH86_06145, partial [Methanosarcinales archaeon]|nr:hypothetical protein [Methanosarcinales archaeon]
SIATSHRNGSMVTLQAVPDDDELMVTSLEGIVTRMPVKEIRTQGRNTQGVRIMKLKDGDRVVAIARIKRDEDIIETIDDDDAGGDNGSENNADSVNTSDSDSNNAEKDEIENSEEHNEDNTIVADNGQVSLDKW